MPYRRSPPTSFRLDVGGADHLGPFLGFVGEELAELGWRERKRGASEIGKARLDFGIARSRRWAYQQSRRAYSWARRPRASRRPRSQAQIRPRSGRPAAPVTASRS